MNLDDLSVRIGALAEQSRVKIASEMETVATTGYSLVQRRVIAHAVRFKAGANLLTSILSSTAINRYTMTAGEQIEAMRKQYLKEYEARVFEYLCPTIAEEENINRYGDCMVCKDRWGMTRSTIQG